MIRTFENPILNIGYNCTILALIFLALACVVESETDSEHQYERPPEAQEIVSDSDLERLEELGVTVYSGSNPPYIGHSYHADALRIYWDETEGGAVDKGACNRMMTFTPTNIDYEYQMDVDYTNCSGGEEGVASFVAGDGDCFTVYADNDVTFNGCDYRSVVILTGCLRGDEGIEDFEYSTIFYDFEQERCHELVSENRLSAEGDFRLRRQAFAPRVDH